MNTVSNDWSIDRQLFQILTKASLESLQKGDILRGRVQSMENGLLLIKLLDGSSFTASAPEGFSANIGDFISLEIGERINDQLTARILSADPNVKYEGQPVDSALLAQIKHGLAAYGASASERLITDVLDILNSRPGLPVNEASFLAANGLANDPGMMDVLGKIAEHEFQLHHHLSNLQDGLQKAISEMDPLVRNDLLRPLIIEQETHRLFKSLDQIFSGVSPKINDSILQNIKEILTKTLMQELSDQGDPALPKALDFKALEGLIQNALHSLEDSASDKGEGLTQSETHASITSDGQSLFSTKELDAILKSINKALTDIHLKTGKLSEQGTEGKVVESIKEALDKLFDKAIVKAEKDMAEGTDIKDKAKALKDVTEFSQKALNQADQNNRDAILPAFKEIDNAFRFFSQVSTYDSVLQLPIHINNKETTGELYIMKRKNGRKKLDPDNFTLLLSLQTQGMGYIESFLNASKRCVTISFRVEREELVKLVKDNYRILYDGLQKKGFTLVDMKCRILEDNKTSILDAGQMAGQILGIQSKVDLKI